MLPGYHFEVREPEVSFSESHGVYNFRAKFPANPAILANPERLKFNAENVLIPDINRDGFVNAGDSSDIMNAYGNLATGQPSGLDDEHGRSI